MYVFFCTTSRFVYANTLMHIITTSRMISFECSYVNLKRHLFITFRKNWVLKRSLDTCYVKRKLNVVILSMKPCKLTSSVRKAKSAEHMSEYLFLSSYKLGNIVLKKHTAVFYTDRYLFTTSSLFSA